MTRVKPTPLRSGHDAVGEGRAYGAGEHWYGPPAADAAVDDLFEHLVEEKDLAPGEVARDHAERDTPREPALLGGV